MRVEADVKTIGMIVREKRTEKGMSQQDVLFQINQLERQRYPKKKKLISFEWLRQLERGDPRTISTERLGYLAEVLEIPISQFLPVIASETHNDVGAVALALRGYGVSERSVEKILQYIHDEKEATGDWDGPIPKPTEDSEI